jgi:hypothetical protein
MLKHFGSGPNNDAVLGDLAEQYRQKDSALWYWRQAMKAIPVNFFEEIRGHKWIAARALLIGWGMWILFVTLIFPYLTPFFLGSNLGVSIEPRDPIGTAWTVLSAPVGVQTNIERPSIVFGFVLPLIVWGMCGWLVARFHRDQQTSVVLCFAGSILLLALLFFGKSRSFLYFSPPASWLLYVYVRNLVLYVGVLALNIAPSVLGILLGGGLLRDKSRIVSN